MVRMVRSALLVATAMAFAVVVVGAGSPGAAGAQTTPSADLSVDLDADARVVAVGGVATFSVTVRNHGPDTAQWLFVLVHLPLQLEAVTATLPPGRGTCTAAGDGVDCSLPSVAPGEALEIVVGAVVQGPGTAVVSAQVSSSTPEPVPDPTPNTGSLALEAVTFEPDYGITVAGPTVATVGDPVDFTIRMARSGGPVGTGFTIVDRLPSELLPVEATFVVGAGDPEPGPAGSCPIVGQEVTCSLGDGPVERAEVVVRALPVAPGRDLTQVATLTGHFPGGVPPDGAWDASWTTDVTDGAPAVDLALAGTSGAGRVSVGDPVTFTYSIVNLGDLLATGVVLAVEVGAGLQVVDTSIGGSGSTCAVVGQAVTCDVGSLAPAAGAVAVRLDLVAAVEVGETWTVARVGADQPEAFDEVGANEVRTPLAVLGPESIGGSVSDAAGRPIAGVGVRAWVPGRRVPAGSGLSGADGSYEILGLEPGTYQVEFEAPSGSDVAAQWFDGQPTRATATPVVLPEGVEVRGIDAVWDVASIEGTITREGGDPVEGARVAFCRTTDTWLCPLEARTDAEGHYAKPVLAPGTYQVHIAPPAGSGLQAIWFDGVVSRYATTPVVLEGGRTTRLDAVLSPLPTGSVSGRVTGPDGSPLAGARVIAYGPADTWVGSYQVQTAGDGSYTLDHVEADTYLVMVVTPSGTSPARTTWYGHRTRRFATPVVIATGPVGGIDVSFGGVAGVAGARVPSGG